MKTGDKIIITPLQRYGPATAWCEIENGFREFVVIKALPCAMKHQKMEVIIDSIDYMEGDPRDISQIHTTFQKFVDEELECECEV